MPARTGRVAVDAVDPMAVTLDIATEIARVTAEQMALEAPNMVPPTAEGILLQARHGHDDMPIEGLWLARTSDGEILGHAALMLSHWDNPQLADVFCSVAPPARGNGAGEALLDAQLDAARAHGRTTLIAFNTPHTHSAGFLQAHGFEIAQENAQRRLRPQQLDYARIAALAAEAASVASDYELVRADGPVDEDTLPSLTKLFVAINDAPLDDVALEPDEFPVERLRRYDIAMAKRRSRVYRIMARHRRTGEWAGHTILCVDETRPGYAAQEDTSVIRAHRGHRLGMWLKASMLLWMRDERPELTVVDTWNAVSNRHMIAVNEALGCEVSHLGVVMQRSL